MTNRADRCQKHFDKLEVILDNTDSYNISLMLENFFLLLCFAKRDSDLGVEVSHLGGLVQLSLVSLPVINPRQINSISS